MFTLLILVFFAVVCGAIAHEKNRNVVGWVALGFFFGLLSLIAIICLPKLGMQNAD